MASYPPLRTATSTRLLVLHPGADGDDLIGSFKVEDLDQPRQMYAALSYHWGPAVFPQRIQIDGSMHNITQTLYDALVRLRWPSKACVLWADAVCINHSANEERQHQVRLMKKIYSQCVGCIIYLGPEADGSELVPDFLRDLIEWYQEKRRKNDLHTLHGAIVPPEMNEYFGLPGPDNPGWAALKRLLRRPYFYRVWIIQEYALPKAIIMVCGKWQMRGSTLPAYVSLFSTRVRLNALLFDGKAWASGANITIQHLEHLRRVTRQHQEGERTANSSSPISAGPKKADSLRMHKLLMEIGDFSASDPRDMYYGLLGLASDVDDDMSLLPDYGKTLEEIEADFYVSFIRQGFGYDILAMTWPNVTRPKWMGFLGPTSNALSSAFLAEGILTKDADRLRTAIHLNVDRRVTVLGHLVDSVRYRTQGCWRGRGSSILKEIPGMIMHIVRGKEEPEAIPCGELARHNPSDWETCVRLAVRLLYLESSRAETGTLDTLKLCEKHFNWLLGPKDMSESRDSEDVPFDPRSEIAWEQQSVETSLRRSVNTCFGVTESGCFGMFSTDTAIGDEIFMMDGSPKTFLVRHRPQTDTYSWLGEVYVHEFDEQVRRAITTGPPQTICLGTVPETRRQRSAERRE